jgi:hypothetical protein
MFHCLVGPVFSILSRYVSEIPREGPSSGQSRPHEGRCHKGFNTVACSPCQKKKQVNKLERTCQG